MKIIKLTAENVKRLRAVEITPDGNVQVITGRNAQGKTSVLDAIWLGLGGGTASRETRRPIRDGETHAAVTLDLGDLVVTRTWTGDKTALTVTTAEGARYSSPQRVLDALVGRLSFDPLEFTRLTAREQVAALLDLVDLDVDLDAMAADRARLYEQRRSVGQMGKAIGDVPPMVPGVPTEEVSAAELIGQLREAETADRQIQEAAAAADRWRERISQLQRELEQAKTALQDAEVVAARPVVDTGALTTRLDKLEETNRAVRANAAAAAKAADRDRLRTSYDDLTAQINELDQAKNKALGAAQFPVDGLGFDDDGVTYNGVPFSQASSAEQIRVSLAMAMSLNPELRVIRILDGSLLDGDNLKLISEMAAAQDYQVWIERVADGSDVGVVIEDGEVAA